MCLDRDDVKVFSGKATEIVKGWKWFRHNKRKGAFSPPVYPKGFRMTRGKWFHTKNQHGWVQPGFHVYKSKSGAMKVRTWWKARAVLKRVEAKNLLRVGYQDGISAFAAASIRIL